MPLLVCSSQRALRLVELAMVVTVLAVALSGCKKKEMPIERRVPLGVWQQKLIENPSRIMEAYLATAQRAA